MAIINDIDLDKGTITYQPLPFPLPEPYRSQLMVAGKMRNHGLIDQIERELRAQQPVITRKLLAKHTVQ